MKKRARRKANVFEKESQLLQEAKEVLQKLQEEDIAQEEVTKHVASITQSFDQLLQETKLITSVSDRLQNKLNRANEKITEQNRQLQETIDMLTKARVGRRAATLVLVLAIVLFVISEAIIEPQIDEYVGNNFIVGLTFKGIIAILLKPIESVIERLMLNRALKAQKAAKQEAVNKIANKDKNRKKADNYEENAKEYISLSKLKPKKE